MGLLSLTSCTSTKTVAVPVLRLPAGPLSIGRNKTLVNSSLRVNTRYRYMWVIKTRLICGCLWTGTTRNSLSMLFSFPPCLFFPVLCLGPSLHISHFASVVSKRGKPQGFLFFLFKQEQRLWSKNLKSLHIGRHRSPLIIVTLNCKWAALKIRNKTRAVITNINTVCVLMVTQRFYVLER